MPMIPVVGPQGSGKSLISLYFSRITCNLFKKEYGIILPIYTNINAFGDNIIVISDLGEIPFNRDPKILILDEAMFSMDSRRSGSEENVIWSRMIAYFRKLNFCIVFFNTHTPAMMDSRIRDQAPYMIMCRKSKLRFEYLLLDLFSQQPKPFYIPKNQSVYDFCDFDTHDFPNPITTDLLQKNMPEFFTIKTKKNKGQAVSHVVAEG